MGGGERREGEASCTKEMKRNKASIIPQFPYYVSANREKHSKSRGPVQSSYEIKVKCLTDLIMGT